MATFTSDLSFKVDSLKPTPYTVSWRLPPKARNARLHVTGSVSYSHVGIWMSVSGTTPSEVKVTLLGDLTGDWRVDGADLAVLNGYWGGPGADLNGDGVTGGEDQAILLAEWTAQ